MYLNRSWFGNKYSYMAQGLHDNRVIPPNSWDRAVPMGPGGLRDGGGANGQTNGHGGGGNDDGWVPDNDIDWDYVRKKEVHDGVDGRARGVAAQHFLHGDARRRATAVVHGHTL